MGLLKMDAEFPHAHSLFNAGMMRAYNKTISIDLGPNMALNVLQISDMLIHLRIHPLSHAKRTATGGGKDAIHYDRPVDDVRLLRVMESVQGPFHLAVLPDATLKAEVRPRRYCCGGIRFMASSQVLLEFHATRCCVTAIVPKTMRSVGQQMLAHVSRSNFRRGESGVRAITPSASPV
jgi:hypothetical protein